jgi:purine-binding chemotaxis protein CheW
MMTTSMQNGAIRTKDAQQFLVFSLGEEEYGIEILDVQEIKGLADVTPVPNAPDHVKGVLNLRGTVIPIIDLRLRFAMAERPYDRFAVIVVVSIEDKRVGLVVDGVSDVLGIPAEQIDESPPLAHDLDTNWFRGVGNLDGRLVFLLDTAQLTGLQNLGIET